MLVYLDTAHFDYLERDQNHASTERLLETWENAGCELALSYLHLREIYQLGSAESIRRRLAVLERFPRVRFSAMESIVAIEHEIREQFEAQLVVREPNYNKIRNIIFPPLTKEDFQIACMALEDPEAGALRKLEEHRAAWANEARPHLEYVRKLMKITHGKPLLPDVDPALLPSKEELDSATKDAEDPVLAMMEEFYRKVPRTRSRRSHLDLALDLAKQEPALRSLKILSSIPQAKSFPEEDLGFVAGFYRMASSVSGATPDLLGNQVLTLWSVVQQLDPYASPGYRLAMAVERARQRSAKSMSASDFLDFQHVMMMPYVDLAFVDKRTFDYLRAGTQYVKRPLSKEEIAHIHKTGNLDLLRAHIESRVEKLR